jgi:TetR/AcrR family transcriptional repressor of mexJK operon
MDILADKKMMIVEAAKKRFAHFGFLKVTMDEIATDVEMGKASLYYYFQTKEDLFRAVIASEMDHLQADIGKLFLKKNSASQKLLEYTELRMKFFQDLINLGTLSVHSYLSTKSIFKKHF